MPAVLQRAFLIYILSVIVFRVPVVLRGALHAVALRVEAVALAFEAPDAA